MGNRWDNVSLYERLMYRVDTSAGPTGCWPKAGHHDGDGYPLIKVNGKRVHASRISWQLANGRELAPGEWVLHRCDNPTCVNPAHLFIGDAASNTADKVAKGRQARGENHGAHTKPESVMRGDRHYYRLRPDAVLRGERHGQARLTTAQVVEIRASSESQGALARRYGVTLRAIQKIRRRETWRHVP